MTHVTALLCCLLCVCLVFVPYATHMACNTEHRCGSCRRLLAVARDGGGVDVVAYIPPQANAQPPKEPQPTAQPQAQPEAQAPVQYQTQAPVQYQTQPQAEIQTQAPAEYQTQGQTKGQTQGQTQGQF